MDLLRHNLKKRFFVTNENKTDEVEKNQEDQEDQEINNESLTDFKTELKKLKLYFNQQINDIKKELEDLKNIRIKEDKVEDKLEDKVEDKLEDKLEDKVEAKVEELDIFSSIPTVEKELKPKPKPRTKKTADKKGSEINVTKK